MEVDKMTEKLVNDLAKPIYVYRMAKAMATHPHVRSKSAETRLRNAEKAIQEIVQKYVNEII